jgi:hypothetical protein
MYVGKQAEVKFLSMKGQMPTVSFWLKRLFSFNVISTPFCNTSNDRDMSPVPVLFQTIDLKGVYGVLIATTRHVPCYVTWRNSHRFYSLKSNISRETISSTSKTTATHETEDKSPAF